MKEGAADFVTKPLRRANIVRAVRKALERRQLLMENQSLRDELARTLRAALRGFEHSVYLSGMVEHAFSDETGFHETPPPRHGAGDARAPDARRARLRRAGGNRRRRRGTRRTRDARRWIQLRRALRARAAAGGHPR